MSRLKQQQQNHIQEPEMIGGGGVAGLGKASEAAMAVVFMG